MSLVAGTGKPDKPRSHQQSEADVDTLVRYSLIEPLEGGRLCLHALLREYAGERLEKVAKSVRARLGAAMVAYWLAYAENFPGEKGMAALGAEATGLMFALTWAYEQAHYQDVLVLGLAHALERAWSIHGRRDEELRMYLWAKESAQKLGDENERGWAGIQLADIQSRTGQLPAARVECEQALERAHQRGDLETEWSGTHLLAVLDMKIGRMEEARVGFQCALKLVLSQSSCDG